MDKKIILHFKTRDPKIHKLITHVQSLPAFIPKLPETYFEDLSDAIVSQQLSGKAAQIIFNRFKALFPKGEITPTRVLKLTDEKLRSVGLSRAKASYIRDLAEKVENGDLKLNELHNLDDQEVIKKLVKIKGIGRWTAEMFLIFTLGRENVFSLGDLGLRNALKKVYGEKTSQELVEIIQKWSPYKSYASRILWKSLDL